MSKKNSPAELRILLHEGTRQLLPPDTKVLISVRARFERDALFSELRMGNRFDFEIPIPENGAGYIVLVSAKGYHDAGAAVAPVVRGKQLFHLMLLSREADYQFSGAQWDTLPDRFSLRGILRASQGNGDTARRYTDLLADQRDAFAALHNIATALDAVAFGKGGRTALEHLREIDWDNVRRDRFFAFASPSLLADVRNAADEGVFEKEYAPGIFHPGAKESYKQTTFREANLQISFHGLHQCPDYPEPLVRVELDMDYYPSPWSHALLEVIPNTLSVGQRKTDPRRIYAMRWMAGKLVNEDFEPPYTIA